MSRAVLSLLLAIVCASCALPASAQYLRVRENAPASTVLPGSWIGPVADFNNNGFPDMVTPYGALVLDPGVNGVVNPVAVSLPAPFFFYVAGNLDGDANVDLFGYYGGAGFLLGHGDGTFTNLPNPFIPTGIINYARLADLNHDSLDDVILQTYDGATARLEVRINGTPTIPSWSITLPYLPRAEVGDFNGDGNPDLCWTPHVQLYPSGTPTPPATLNQVLVAFGDGNGGFGSPVSYPFTVPTGYGGPFPMTVGDLDGDGRSDLLTASGGVPDLRIWYGSSATGFEPPVLVAWPANFGALGSGNITFGPVLWQCFVYDFDADGDPDIIRSAGIPPVIAWPVFPFTAHGMAIDVLNGTGYRSWATLVRRDLVLPPAAGTRYAAADFDHDGDVDLIGLGEQSIAPNAVYLDNVALFGSGCAGAGVVPNSLQGDLTLGNAGYYAAVHNAAPNALAAFAVSLDWTPSTTCGIYVGLSPGQLLLPSGSFGYTTTSAAGDAILGLPLPPSTLLAGGAVISQWFVADPLGALSAGTGTFAASRGRVLVLW